MVRSTQPPPTRPASPLCEAEQHQAEYLTEDEERGAMIVMAGVLLLVFLFGLGLGLAL